MLSLCDDYRGVKLDLSTRPVLFGGVDRLLPKWQDSTGICKSCQWRALRMTEDSLRKLWFQTNRPWFLETEASVSEDLKIAGIQFNTIDAATEKVLPMLSLVLGRKHCCKSHDHMIRIILNVQNPNQIGRLSYVMMIIIYINKKHITN